MEEDSTTDAANNLETDSNATTDVQTDTTTDNGDNGDDNLSTSTSTEEDSTDGGNTTTDENSTDEVTHAKQFDIDLAEWAEKTGRKTPETDEDRALLQEVRDGQREFTRSKQAKDAARDVTKAANDAKPEQKADEYADPLEERVARAEARQAEEQALRLRSEYVTEHSVTLEETNVMGAILKEKVEKAAAISPEKAQQAYDYWTDPNNLEDWHALAKARMSSNSSTDNSEIEAEADRKEREKIARESKANGPVRNAATTSTGAKTEDQKRLERFSNWD
jgi:hypothetical protein